MGYRHICGRIPSGTCKQVNHDIRGRQLFGPLVGVGFVLGLAAYIYSRLPYGIRGDISSLMESGIYGAGICAGLHLAICAIVPSELVHLVTAEGAPFIGPPELRIDMDILHRIHIAAGGVATVYICYRPLRRMCGRAPWTNRRGITPR